MRVIRKDALLLKTLTLATDRANIHAGDLADAVVRFARIANELADYRSFLVIEFSHGFGAMESRQNVFDCDKNLQFCVKKWPELFQNHRFTGQIATSFSLWP